MSLLRGCSPHDGVSTLACAALHKMGTLWHCVQGILQTQELQMLANWQYRPNCAGQVRQLLHAGLSPSCCPRIMNLLGACCCMEAIPLPQPHCVFMRRC